MLLLRLIRPREASIVKTLKEKDDIGERIIYRQNDHRGEHPLQHGTKNVEDISGKPDDEEEQGKRVRRFPTKVFNNLGREYDDPACDGNRTAR